MKLKQPDNEKVRVSLKIFPYHPELKYLAIFLSVMVSIPVITYVIFYYLLLPEWLGSNAVEDFNNIKGVLVKYGELSPKQSEVFSNKNISGSDNPHIQKAVQLAQLDLSGKHLWRRLILPLIIVLGTFISFTLRFRVPGVTKSRNLHARSLQEKELDNLAEKTLCFLNDYNKVAITVGGFIISILGGFLVSSGLNNFYFFLGFETIVFSLISSLFAYPSFISSINIEQPDDKPANMISMNKAKLRGYFKIANFASWSLILGLVLLAASFS